MPKTSATTTTMSQQSIISTASLSTSPTPPPRSSASNPPTNSKPTSKTKHKNKRPPNTTSYDFDIDTHLNPYVPLNRIHRLPTVLSWFLGYRKRRPPRKIGSVLVWWWAFVGAFAGLLVVEAVFRTDVLRREGTPLVVASFGAAAILEYHVIDSPLSQPRNAILGQLLSALIGTSVSKLFQLLPPSSFSSFRWISGALAVGLASAAMGVTKTVHPPAGATALLCCTDPAIVAVGWEFLWMVGLGSVLMVGVALVVNNAGRVWPVYWWTAVDLGEVRDGWKQGGEGNEDMEKGEGGGEVEEAERRERGEGESIVIHGDSIHVPPWLGLEFEEQALLEMLSARLRDGRERRESHATTSTITAADNHDSI